jgi:uncharacterized iron-regulated membrane protein
VSWAAVHRWLAIALVALLVVWSVTGVLFHLKPGWDRAYDQLAVERPGPLKLAAIVPSSSIEAALEGAAIARVTLFDSQIGPLYRVSTAAGTELVDATTGKKRSPLTVPEAESLIADAVSRSPHRAAYGSPTATHTDERTVKVDFKDATVTLGRSDARISQHAESTGRIDWLYRIHYLQWTGNKTIDRAFAVLGLALIWAVMIPGILLFVRRFRRIK